MPSVKSAATYARERLDAGNDITPKERINLLRIISADDRQRKLSNRAKADAKGSKRYSKKTKQAVPQAYKGFVPPEEQTKSSKKDKRNLETSVHTKSQTLGEFLVTVPVESTPVAEPVAETPVVVAEKPAAPAPVVAPIRVTEFQY
jgi:hypothetical protein